MAVNSDRLVVIVVIVFLATGSQSLGQMHVERKSGSCTLGPLDGKKFVERAGYTVAIGTAAPMKCWIYTAPADDDEASNAETPAQKTGNCVRVHTITDNVTDRRIFATWYLAFFDKADHLISCVGCDVNNEMTPRHTGYGYCPELYLPEEVSKSIASYQIVYYESDKKIGTSGGQSASVLPDSKRETAQTPPQWERLWAGGNHGTLQQASGECRLKQGGFAIDKNAENALSVDFGAKSHLNGWCNYWIQYENEKWSVRSYEQIVNPTSVPMYCCFCTAFFDKSGNLVGGLQRSTSQSPYRRLPASHIASGESGCTHSGNASVVLPAEAYQSIVKYRLSYFECAVEQSSHNSRDTDKD